MNNELIFEVTEEADGGYVADPARPQRAAAGWRSLPPLGVSRSSSDGKSHHSSNWNTEPSTITHSRHKSLRVGTLNAILKLVANHKGRSREEILKTVV